MPTFSNRHQQLVEQLDVLLRARYPLIYLITREEEAVEKALQQLPNHTKLKVTPQILAWDVARGWQDNGQAKGNLMGAFGRIQQNIQDNHLSQGQEASIIYHLRDIYHFFKNNTPNAPIIRELKNLVKELKYTRQTIIITSHFLELPVELSEEVNIIDFPLPDIEEINQIIETKVNPDFVKLRLEERENLVKAFQGLTATKIELILAKAVATKSLIDESDIKIVLEEKRQIIRQTQILEFLNTQDSLDNVGGLENLKNWVQIRQASFSSQAKEYGIPTPKGVLLVGIQGTGKSLSAKTIAFEWKFPLLRLDVGRLFGGIVGESESRVRQMIQITEAIAPCVLWIDEVDKAFGNITSGIDGDSGTSRRVFGTIITWMQEKTSPVFIVATANDVKKLPAEFLRKGRFDEIFFLNLPTPREREQIFAVQLQKFRPQTWQKYDIPILAREANNFNGAEIEQTIIDAMQQAYTVGREFTNADIIAAISQTVPLAAIAREQIAELIKWANERGAKSASLA